MILQIIRPVIRVRAGGMDYYRCYILGSDTKIMSAETAAHPSDATAIEWAERLLRDRPQATGVELWTDSRVVHRKIRS